MKKGSKHTPEALALMREGLKAKYAARTPEDKKRMTAHLQQPHDPATIQKQSESGTRYWASLTEEQREARRAKQREASAKPETRKKKSDARKAYFAAHPEELEASIARITSAPVRKKQGEATRKWRADPKNSEEVAALNAKLRAAAAEPAARKRKSESMRRVMQSRPALAQAIGDRSRAVWAAHRAKLEAAGQLPAKPKDPGGRPREDHEARRVLELYNLLKDTRRDVWNEITAIMNRETKELRSKEAYKSKLKRLAAKLGSQPTDATGA